MLSRIFLSISSQAGSIGTIPTRSNHLSADGVPDREIAAPDERVRVLVIRAREDLEIARQARAVLGRPPA
jgi:acetate kinase